MLTARFSSINSQDDFSLSKSPTNPFPAAAAAAEPRCTLCAVLFDPSCSVVTNGRHRNDWRTNYGFDLTSN
ncbi:hypothetical protein F2P81_008637 [Scophthalmus maximus]|uniref:Uncharacterized protein n=1 Tax=Scophthalmus maximus TaxID=52904 RepID=A0A6A4SW85_SCOMX|nr:hypothetical protein F2P81_008637 [Scophthalmus maximus]